MGTPGALDAALLKIHGEVGCNQLEQHPLYPELKSRMSSIALARTDGETLSTVTA
jgi:hypothetical protein